MATPTRDPADPLIGRRLAQFRVLDRLGSGGMGVVYLAEDTELHRRVALKVLPAEMAAQPERLERFRREALALAGLNHPNVVTIHSLDQADGQSFLVMELIEGRPLGEEIPSDGMPLDGFFRIAVALADALSAAHERGVTHRDLKPANVMVTGEGRVKVVDFGLAKLREGLQARQDTVVLEDQLTEAGRLLGSYPYMAPEQAKGLPADHRSDLFSLGVVLYEMATGARPFQGETSVELLSSILRDRPPPIDELRAELPRELGRIVAHCLEKDPERRFQTAKDLRNQLQSLWDEWRSDSLAATGSRSASALRGPGRARPGRRRLAAAAVVVAVLAAGGWAAWQWGALSGRSGPSAGDPESSSLAVLPFENLAGDPELDWLRSGLTEMLVTELSRSPGLRILSTDELYGFLGDVAEGGSEVTPQAIRRLGSRAGVTHALRGSFVRAGETLQIHVRIQKPETGSILQAARVEGTGVASIFTLIDQLGRDLRQSLPVPRERAPPDRGGIESVTTSSIEAFRHYVEGLDLARERKLAEAIPLFERAIELDPGFAMAHASLSSVHDLLGHPGEAAESNQRAFDLAERLPLRERLYVQGRYHAERWETLPQAVELLTQSVELFPDHHQARKLLADVYADLELFDLAAEQCRQLIESTGDPTAHHYLAHAYASQGRFDDGLAVLRSLEDREPESWWSHFALGWHLTNWGRLDQASAALGEAEELRPGSPYVALARWRLFLLQGDFRRAAEAEAELRGFGDPYWHWIASLDEATRELYTGDPEAALAMFREMIEAYSGRGPLSAAAHNWTADLLLQLDRPAEALDQARLAQEQGHGDWPELEGWFHAALAHQALGEPDRARELARRLEEQVEGGLGARGPRLRHRLLGELALARGDTTEALRELGRAEALLPARGIAWSRKWLPDHVPIRYALARARLAAGDLDGAEATLREIVASGTERSRYPLRFIRSHYLLADLLERRGAEEEARELLRRFVSFWREGDLDRERVADALARLGEAQP